MIQIKRSELKQLAQNKLGDDSLESQNKILVMISTSLAESMWDAYNESIPKELKAGEWHIPYGDKLEVPQIQDLYKKHCSSGYDPNNPIPDEYYYKALDELTIKISTAMCARTSYTVVGDEKEVSYETLLKVHDKCLEMKHSSVFEHCARAMNDVEYETYIKGICYKHSVSFAGNYLKADSEKSKGWCRNYKGFIQYREFVENGLTI